MPPVDQTKNNNSMWRIELFTCILEVRIRHNLVVLSHYEIGTLSKVLVIMQSCNDGPCCDLNPSAKEKVTELIFSVWLTLSRSDKCI